MEEIRDLDFSVYHPLDHHLFDCVGYPGGRIRHLVLCWEYQLRPELRRLTLCKLGLHSWVEVLTSEPIFEGKERKGTRLLPSGDFMCVDCNICK